MSVGTSAFVAITSIIPLAGLAAMSSVKALTTLEAPWHLLTAANWHQIASDATFRRAMSDSLIIAGGGGALTVLLVATATLIAHRSGFFLRRSLAPALVYPRAVPGIILGIGFFWAYLMISPGALVRNNLWGELIALCARNRPATTGPCASKDLDSSRPARPPSSSKAARSQATKR